MDDYSKSTVAAGGGVVFTPVCFALRQVVDLCLEYEK